MHFGWTNREGRADLECKPTEWASVNGCKLQGGGDKCPAASVLNEQIERGLKAWDFASSIYKMNH